MVGPIDVVDQRQVDILAIVPFDVICSSAALGVASVDGFCFNGHFGYAI